MTFNGNETKEHLLAKGIELVQEFAMLNKIPHPNIFIYHDINDGFYGYIHYGNVIRINMKLCRAAVKTPGYDWTFPGSVNDLTPYGILAHEFGHYISDYISENVDTEFRKNFSRLKKHENNVTYMDDKDVDERMAEAARLFLTNPDLLKRARPKRYGFFAEHYTPVVKKRWKTVLKNAHPKIITSVENWMKL